MLDCLQVFAQDVLDDGEDFGRALHRLLGRVLHRCLLIGGALERVDGAIVEVDTHRVIRVE